MSERELSDRPVLKEEEFYRYLKIFDNHLKNFINDTISVNLATLPGWTGEPVSVLHPLLFFKKESLHTPEKETLSNFIMPLLYHHGIRSYPHLSKEMERLTPALINYALWRGSFGWIFNLAGIIPDNHPQRDDLYLTAALVCATEGYLPHASRYLKLYGKKVPCRVGMSLGMLLTDNNYQTLPAEGCDALWIQYYSWAFKHKRLEERETLNRLLATNTPASSLFWEVMLALEVRGELFYAARAYGRFAAKHPVCREALFQLYFKNGKYFHSLKHLARYTPLSPVRWYQAQFALKREGWLDEGQTKLSEIFDSERMPPIGIRVAFIEALSKDQIRDAGNIIKDQTARSLLFLNSIWEQKTKEDEEKLLRYIEPESGLKVHQLFSALYPLINFFLKEESLPDVIKMLHQGSGPYLYARALQLMIREITGGRTLKLSDYRGSPPLSILLHYKAKRALKNGEGGLAKTLYRKLNRRFPDSEEIRYNLNIVNR